MLICIFVLGFCLRFYGLDRDLGDGDEAAMLLYFGFSSFKYIVTNYFDPNNHIFHTLLVRLMSNIFGDDNVVAIRFPSFIFGFAGLWMIYIVAKKLFNSKIALISLILAVLSPIHLVYSQSARGYSLIIFFSLVMFYSTLIILESKSFLKWGFVLFLSGFLSVYTIPTTLYFLFALFVWTIYFLFFPSRIGKQSNQIIRSKKINGLVFLTIYFLVVLISLLAFWDLIDQIPLAINSNTSVESQFQNISGWNVLLLVPKILVLCFLGPQKWFLPFIIFGMIGMDSNKKHIKTIPIFILFLPFLLNIVLGFTGFSRNYLFNWPFLIIFASAGLVFFSNFFSQYLPFFFTSKNLLSFF